MMMKRMLALALSLALAAGLCPGAALAATGLTAGSASGQDTAMAAGLAAEGGAALSAQASKEAALAKRATKLAKRATKLMNALPKSSKIKLAHAGKTAAAFEAASAATANWAAFEKVGTGTRKAFLKAFNNKFVPACYALEKQIKNTTEKTKKVQVKNVKAAPGNNSAAVSWKKLGAGYRYEVYYSAKKSSGYKKADSTANAKLTVKGLAGGKTYYFKVRAYRAGVPASALVGSLSDIAYGKYSSPAAATPKAPLAASSADLGTQATGSAPGTGAAGAVLGAQVASTLSQSQDALDSCRVYLRDIRGKGKNGYATGTLKGDLDKMKGVIGNLDAYADKVKADRLKKNSKALGEIKSSSYIGAGEEVWQTGTGPSNVTVKWGYPAIARNSDVTMLHWRISWRKLGDVGWSAPKTVAYSPYSRECAVTGLSQGTTYEVRVGYRYQVGNGQGTYVTVDDWRSCTATTFMNATLGLAIFDYHFSTHNKSWAALKVKLASPALPEGFWREWYVTAGPTFNSSKANKDYGKGLESGSVYHSRHDPHNSIEEDISAGAGLQNGHAVVTLGVRTAYVVPYEHTVVRSGWSTKALVADPQFLIGKDIVSNYKLTGFVVEIPPLKDAKSYTVYLGKRKDAESSKVTDWKIAGTFVANEGKTTKAVVDNYGGKKLPQDFLLREWAVKVVTNTMYGSSPGDYWRSYNHTGLVLHEGMVY